MKNKTSEKKTKEILLIFKENFHFNCFSHKIGKISVFNGETQLSLKDKKDNIFYCILGLLESN